MPASCVSIARPTGLLPAPHAFLSAKIIAEKIMGRHPYFWMATHAANHDRATLQAFYAAYRKNTAIDAFAALLTVQATLNTQQCRIFADRTAIDAFDDAAEPTFWFEGCEMSCATQSYTANAIDLACDFAERYLRAGKEGQEIYLTFSTTELQDQACRTAEMATIPQGELLHMAATLAEARQDTNRLPHAARFAYAVQEGDLCPADPWVRRMAIAYRNQLGITVIPDLLLEKTHSEIRQAG